MEIKHILCSLALNLSFQARMKQAEKGLNYIGGSDQHF
jgi:hypothetical protein